jgi:hypothetical protein
MKNKIAIASAFFAASSFSFAEIALTENLSVEGFVDMSYTDSDADDSAFGIDQVEFDFLFSQGAVSAQVDVEYEEGADQGATTEIEQAFVTYDLGNGAALTAGRFASQLGFEAFEPTGLYQYSTAYSERTGLPGYDEGVKYTTEINGNYFGLAIVEAADTQNQPNTIGDGAGYSIEAAYAIDLAGVQEGLSAFVGARYDVDDADADDDLLVNAYVTYETGAWIFAAEVVHLDDGDQHDSSALVMANYTYSDAASITARYSVEDGSDNVGPITSVRDASKITLAHNYALADNLALITELSEVDVDGADEELEFAVELLFTF